MKELRGGGGGGGGGRVEWRENDRRYSLESKKNDAGRFILCSVADEDGKRHRLFFSEGNGLVNGWTLLEEALQDMGTKESRGEKRKSTNTNFHKKAEILKEDQIKNQPCPDTMSSGKNQDTIWLDISDCILKGDLGLLKYGVAGKWKSQPATDTI